MARALMVDRSQPNIRGPQFDSQQQQNLSFICNINCESETRRGVDWPIIESMDLYRSWFHIGQQFCFSSDDTSSILTIFLLQVENEWNICPIEKLGPILLPTISCIFLTRIWAHEPCNVWPGNRLNHRLNLHRHESHLLMEFGLMSRKYHRGQHLVLKWVRPVKGRPSRSAYLTLAANVWRFLRGDVTLICTS